MYSSRYYSSDEPEFDEGERIITLAIGIVIFIVSCIITYVTVQQSGKILDNMQRAIRLSSDEQFTYAMKTQYAGGVWGTGIATLVPVSDQHLKEKYGAIQIVKERYNHHSSTTCSGSGKNRVCTTRTWNSWDYDSTYEGIGPTVEFMGTVFQHSQVTFDYYVNLAIGPNDVTPEYKSYLQNNYIYERNDRNLFGTIAENVGDYRIYFKATPVQFQGAMYIRSTNKGYINWNDAPCGCTIAQASADGQIESMKSTVWFYQNIFWWLLPLAVIICLVIYFYFFQN
jgi:hypothetical protein